MNLKDKEKIIKAIAEGKKVYWKNKRYDVLKDNLGSYLIVDIYNYTCENLQIYHDINDFIIAEPQRS